MGVDSENGIALDCDVRRNHAGIVDEGSERSLDDAGIDGGGLVGNGNGKRLTEFVHFDHEGNVFCLYGDVDDASNTT